MKLAVYEVSGHYGRPIYFNFQKKIKSNFLFLSFFVRLILEIARNRIKSSS